MLFAPWLFGILGLGITSCNRRSFLYCTGNMGTRTHISIVWVGLHFGSRVYSVYESQLSLVHLNIDQLVQLSSLCSSNFLTSLRSQNLHTSAPSMLCRFNSSARGPVRPLLPSVKAPSSPPPSKSSPSFCDYGRSLQSQSRALCHSNLASHFSRYTVS